VTVDVSRSMWSALEAAKVQLQAGLDAISATIDGERGFAWLAGEDEDDVQNRGVEVVTDMTQKPGVVPNIRLQAVANTSNPPCAGLDNQTWDLIVTCVIREHTRLADTDTKQHTATLRAGYLARACELVLKSRASAGGLWGLEGVYSIKNAGSAHTRPFEGDPSLVAYEFTLRCTQRVHDPF